MRTVILGAGTVIRHLAAEGGSADMGECLWIGDAMHECRDI